MALRVSSLQRLGESPAAYHGPEVEFDAFPSKFVDDELAAEMILIGDLMEAAQFGGRVCDVFV